MKFPSKKCSHAAIFVTVYNMQLCLFLHCFYPNSTFFPFKVSKSECVETTKPTTSIAPTAAIFPTSAIPVGETTHFVPITRGVEGNLGSLHSGTPCSLVTPKPVFSIGNYQEPSTPTHVIGSNIQSAQTLSREVQSLAATAEYEGNACLDEVVEQVQKTDQEFSSPRKTSLGFTESFSSLEMKLEKRKGKKRVRQSVGCLQ